MKNCKTRRVKTLSIISNFWRYISFRKVIFYAILRKDETYSWWDGNRDIFGCIAISSLLHAIKHSQIANMPLKHQYIGSCASFTYTYT